MERMISGGSGHNMEIDNDADDDDDKSLLFVSVLVPFNTRRYNIIL